MGDEQKLLPGLSGVITSSTTYTDQGSSDLVRASFCLFRIYHLSYVWICYMQTTYKQVRAYILGEMQEISLVRANMPVMISCDIRIFSTSISYFWIFARKSTAEKLMSLSEFKIYEVWKIGVRNCWKIGREKWMNYITGADLYTITNRGWFGKIYKIIWHFLDYVQEGGTFTGI